MPLYGYRCGHCGVAHENVVPVANAYLPSLCECGELATRELTAPMVQPDIAPYQAVTGDKVGQQIGSRRAHREFLKRNRLIEVGDAPIRDTKQMRSHIKKGEIREELKRVVPDVLRKQRRA